MAQVVLSGIGQAVGGAPGAMIGSMIGRGIDQAVISSLEPARQRGPRLERLKLQGTAEGAPMACVLGRARVTGQVIWAARFREDRRTTSAGKSSPRTVEFGYSLSFAVALCEGQIDGIGRVWADGQPMDLSGVALRVHEGGETQTPDPLIEAVEGEAPAYRGTAYVVFEDLPLGPYGNRVPQLAFEIFRRPQGETPRLEDRLEGVCLIPGAGEFVLATEPVIRREGLTRTTPENVHGGGGRPDILKSLDLLQAQAPHLKRTSLVIGWFGDDLRAEHCRIRPGVERAGKPTAPLTWSVAGLDRSEAHLISGSGGGPAYGGTPSDESVRQAIAELKRRGLEVTLYPFVFMDVPVDNGLPDPDGAGAQPPYPWRGRVRGRDGERADADVDAVFGGASGWGLRRLALHYAALAAETGADGLLIGSEMRGLTLTRDLEGGFPAVAAFRALAAECRAVVGPDVKLSYAADWSEYAGLREDEEVRFHLDPLWSDANIDYVGIDWYPPLGDWRADGGGLDSDIWAGPTDPGYLALQVAGGEGFDWFYASEADRLAQTRTPIIDGAHGEDWVYRVKDLAGWWRHSHHERTRGARSNEPTSWVPGMKPVRLTEFGCAAVDRGANAPNLFLDPKSAESALPPFSTGERDDRMQRRALDAVLEHFETRNPVSAVYGGPMLEGADLWCWDARSWPDFPALSEVWADAEAWRCGHWLNGRLDGETRDLIAAILRRGGVEEFEIGAFEGEVQGYVVDRPMPTRDALAPLLAGLGLRMAERSGKVAILGEPEATFEMSTAAMALSDNGQAVRTDRQLDARPVTARVRFIDGTRDYQTGSALMRQAGDGGTIDLDLPAVCGPGVAKAAAARVLKAGAGQRATVTLGPVQGLTLEPGDCVTVDHLAGEWCVTGLEFAEQAVATLEPRNVVSLVAEDDLPTPAPGGEIAGAPFFRMIDLPPLPGAEDDGRPLAIVAGHPWTEMQVRAGPSPDALTVRANVVQSTTVATLTASLQAGPRHRWDQVNSLIVRVEGAVPTSQGVTGILAGGNALAVETVAGWEVIQFRRAELLGSDIWRLSGLLRGQQGTEATMRAGSAAGAVVVFLDEPLRASSSSAERGLPLIWRAGPTGLSGGARVAELEWAATGVHHRPWSPAHLRVGTRGDGGYDLGWIARSRTGGDAWDGEDSVAPLRFRVRIIHEDTVVRVLDVEASHADYLAPDVASDFPGGLPGEVIVEVAQWGDGYGWGQAASVTL
ncbi:MAG: glycoside hydrolase/phage tail family protein [Brevundimonas sp.]